MFLFFLLMFTVFPAIELYLLIEVGQNIGAIQVLLLVVATGLVGSKFALNQGQYIRKKLEEDLQQGQMPADTILHGIVVVVGGLLLITPGFISDFLGLCALFPFTRSFFLAFLKLHLSHKIQRGDIRVVNFGGKQPRAQNNQNTNEPNLAAEKPTVIDIPSASDD